MSAVAGVGSMTSFISTYNDPADDITSSAVGQDQDIGDVPNQQTNIGVTIEIIIMSALIFIGILSWFEFIRSWYDHTFADDNHNYGIVYNRLWYAIFISSIVLILLYIVYRLANPKVKWDLSQ